jgi:predicted DNA-binding transcriptional regulator AlpA
MKHSHSRRTRAATPEHSASPRAQHPAADFDPSKLHDDALISPGKAAAFLGLAESSFYLLRRQLGRDFPRPTICVGRPRYRVGAIREWLKRQQEAAEAAS